MNKVEIDTAWIGTAIILASFVMTTPFVRGCGFKASNFDHYLRAKYHYQIDAVDYGDKSSISGTSMKSEGYGTPILNEYQIKTLKENNK